MLRCRGLSIFIAAAILVASLALPTMAGATIKLGVYHCPLVPVGSSCFATSGEAMDSYRSQYGRFPDIALGYRNLDKPLLYSSEQTAFKQRGVIPMMTIEPSSASLQDIANGRYDGYIHSEAASAIAYGKEVLLRFAHEMNGTWYSWNGDPSAYVSAWRHYVDVFRADGATNVKFVWSPNVNSGGRYPFDDYYPEDASHPGYVDYVALDGYNWGEEAGTWKALKAIFRESYLRLNALSDGKPVIIAETASVEEKGKRPAWIRTGFLEAIPKEFPNVVAAVWFNRNLDDGGTQEWALENSAGSVAAWQDVVNSPLYGGNVYYLRPNGSRATARPWTVFNAESAWQALSENAFESVKATTSRGYITATLETSETEPFTSDVALSTTSIAGKKITAASAWLYTPTRYDVRLEVRSGSTRLASQTFTGIGWHSLNLPLGLTQSQLDNAYLQFVSGSEAGTDRVYAAFLRLTLDPA